MKINQASINLIKSFEGFFAKPYLCPAFVATIGYGTIKYPSGVKVKLTDPPITEKKALDYLIYEVTEKAKLIDPMLRDDLTENQFGALVSFSYNLGEGALKQSTLRIKINENPLNLEIRNEFSKWVYANGKKLNGLIRRRKAEADLYFTPS
jgi:lysozyme